MTSFKKLPILSDKIANWYPVKKKTKIEFCPVCYGTGERKDEKTKKIRPCVMCRGTGDWK